MPKVKQQSWDANPGLFQGQNMHSFVIFCPIRNGLVSNVFRRAKGRKSLILAGARKKVVSSDFI